MFFSVIAKNLNWEISTKNLVVFKGWDVIKDEKCQYYGGSLRTSIFRDGSHEKPIYWGDFLKGGEGGALGQFPDLMGDLPKKRGWSFWGGTKPKSIYWPNQNLKLKNCTLGWEVLYYFHTDENSWNKLQNIRRSKNLSYLARYRVMTSTRCRGMNSVRVLKYFWWFFNIIHELVTQSLSLS